jgi:phosphoribosylformylglycinamidine synthase
VGDLIYLLGEQFDQPQLVTLGGSEYLAVIHQTVAGQPPAVDFELERQVQAACRHGIRQGWLHSAHDCADGGLAIALAESCINGQLGAAIHLAATTSAPSRWDQVLFGEGGARILVSVSPEQQAVWEAYLNQQLGDRWQQLGQVSAEAAGLQIWTGDRQCLINSSLAEMGDRYNGAIERALSR